MNTEGTAENWLRQPFLYLKKLESTISMGLPAHIRTLGSALGEGYSYRMKRSLLLLESGLPSSPIDGSSTSGYLAGAFMDTCPN